jgi:hypothetical protein
MTVPSTSRVLTPVEPKTVPIKLLIRFNDKFFKWTTPPYS